jgi:hypothetical protein
MKRLLIASAMVALTSPAFSQGYNAAPRAGQDECPQGRALRAKKTFPPAMTDCEVLDADTSAENRKLQRRVAPPAVTARPTAPPAATPPAPIIAATPVPAQATALHDYEGRIIGKWMTSAKLDRFGDGGTFIAAAFDQGIAVAVRCIQKELSIAVLDIGFDQKPLRKDDAFKLKFRVDNQPAVESYGMAIGDRTIQVATEKDLVKAIRDGRETAVRIENASGVTVTHIFATSGAPRAFADLSRECPID